MVEKNLNFACSLIWCYILNQVVFVPTVKYRPIRQLFQCFVDSIRIVLFTFIEHLCVCVQVRAALPECQRVIL